MRRGGRGDAPARASTSSRSSSSPTRVRTRRRCSCRRCRSTGRSVKADPNVCIVRVPNSTTGIETQCRAGGHHGRRVPVRRRLLRAAEPRAAPEQAEQARIAHGDPRLPAAAAEVGVNGQRGPKGPRRPWSDYATRHGKTDCGASPDRWWLALPAGKSGRRLASSSRRFWPSRRNAAALVEESAQGLERKSRAACADTCRSNVGRPWTKVYSEVCERINRDSAVQLHVWQHLMQDVCTDPYVIQGDVRRWPGFEWCRFYVDPRGTPPREQNLGTPLEKAG